MKLFQFTMLMLVQLSPIFVHIKGETVSNGDDHYGNNAGNVTSSKDIIPNPKGPNTPNTANPKDPTTIPKHTVVIPTTWHGGTGPSKPEAIGQTPTVTSAIPHKEPKPIPTSPDISYACTTAKVNATAKKAKLKSPTDILSTIPAVIITSVVFLYFFM